MDGNDKLDDLFKRNLSEGEEAVPASSWQAIAAKAAAERQKNTKKFLVPFPLWMAASFLAGTFAGGFGFYTYQLKKENTSLKHILTENKYLIQNEPATPSTNFSDNNNFKLSIAATGKTGGTLSEMNFPSQLNFLAVYQRNSGLSGSAPATYSRKRNAFRETENIYRETENIYSDDLASREVKTGGEAHSVNNTANSMNETEEKLPAGAHTAGKTDTVYLVRESATAVKPVLETKQDSKIKKTRTLFGLPFSLGLYVTPELASRSINFSGNSDPDLVKYKEKDEKKWGFSAGMSLDLELPKNFYLRTGINYWNVGEKNDVYINHTTYETQSVTTASKAGPNMNIPQGTIFIDSAGNSSTDKNAFPSSPNSFKNTILLKTNNSVRESVSRFSTTVSNNYQYVGIPVLAGLKLRNGKLSYGVFSGFIANVLVSSSKAVYYVHYDPAEPEKFVMAKRDLARFSVVYSGGIDINYKLSDHLTFNLAPTIKYSLTSVYKDKSAVKQLPYSYGVQVGFKYRF